MLLLRYVLWALTRLAITFRYRIRVHGLEQLRGLKGPVLILPNHPALIDPVLVLAILWPRLRPRPMVYEGNFNNPFLYLLMKMMNAVQVPDLDQASAKARSRAQQAVEGVIEGLRRGENNILWPAGHIQHDGVEHLGSARALADILSAVPQTTVVLVRTRGLWGSMFSFAPTGEHPDIVNRLLAGAGWLLANLLVFTPRRRVDITIQTGGGWRVEGGGERGASPSPLLQLPEPRREVLNPWLEAWYNAGPPDGPTFVPYHFLFGRRTFEFPPPPSGTVIDLARITPQTKEAVEHIVSDKLGRHLTPEEQNADTTLDQLGLDSLDRMEIALTVEHQFGFSGDQVPATLGELWALAQGMAEKGHQKLPAGTLAAWFQPPSSHELAEHLADTIPEAFVARALASRRDVVAADDLAGVLTYERLLTGALILARRFEKLPEPNIGLMLPASVACDTAFMALLLAGKLPVLLNWTTGPANLAHAARLMGLRHVVTSRAFIDRTAIAVEGAEYVYLENVRKGVGKLEQLRTLLTVRHAPGRVRRRTPHPSPDCPTVVLFTSGSEKAPKAVPLTHRNILTNQRTGVPVLGLRRDDSMLGFLPAFHSFGLSVTCVLPLLGGMRVVHHPDPTDAAGLARKIVAYRPTILVGTPTFVSYILERSEGAGSFDSLRLIIVGAEKCPASLREQTARVAPHATLLEGYGITECAPVVSSNGPQANRPGTLGRPLPGVEVRVIDLDTGEDLPRNQLGMLLVSGPTVFPGYIGQESGSPFEERDGKRWYVTGDLVQIDDEGYIHFGGRLKRFLKAGGEMISLPALEEPFARQYPPTQDGPRVAVEGIETEAGRRIVLFTTEPIALREANARLMEEGFRGVMRLDEVRRVDRIPVLGTGKTDYKLLRAMLTPALAGVKEEG
jgi:long-chain-fatty-acid--[acyl-carrier-protein] ligase